MRLHAGAAQTDVQTKKMPLNRQFEGIFNAVIGLQPFKILREQLLYM
jgi:hypothetical protein